MNDVAHNKPVRVISCEPFRGDERDPLLTREWLVTNGLGGYASGTIVGIPTRRYHGMLIAALPAPLGRTMMLNHVSEELRLADRRTVVQLGGEEREQGDQRVSLLPGVAHLVEFQLEEGVPVWRYTLDGKVVVEKRVTMLHRQNTVHVTYRLLRGEEPLRLKIRPAVHFRGHDDPVSKKLDLPYVFTACGDRYELEAPGDTYPPLRMQLHGRRAAFMLRGEGLTEVLYRIEESRGYQHRGDLWSPGHFRVELTRGTEATLVASTESWESIEALTPEEARDAEHARRRALVGRAHPEARTGAAAELVLAADSFVISPAGRVEEAARAHAAGDEARTVIAGYHWFTDWGRDTMISLEGLTLVTGRALEAGYILRTFAQYVKDGLIPNMFPEGERDGLYHTADATLWFFHALDRFLEATNDRTTLTRILPKLREIIDAHVRGTRFGIHVDPKDGLLTQGAEGYQLTWMDAKVDGWVVTPRRGKAVEINALWYNALRLMQRWLGEEGDTEQARRMDDLARRTHASFNARFWYEQGGYLYDVVDSSSYQEGKDDPACRPNQIFSIALPHPVLDPSRWERVLRVVHDKLYTPVGLRSLSEDHPDFKARYYGDLRTRDAAYHQGTVWGWLIGPFVDAWLKVHPDDRAGARRMVEAFMSHLGEGCVGSVSEIFDAEEPFTPRGCIAQAWSVAEVLRAWVKTSG